MLSVFLFFKCFKILKPVVLAEFTCRMTPKYRKRSIQIQIKNLIYMYLFSKNYCLSQTLPSKSTEWSRERLSRLNVILIKFLLHYRKLDGSRINSTLLKNCIAGFQRKFRSVWDINIQLTSGDIFSHPKTGFMSVVNKVIRKQKVKALDQSRTIC